ncbi:bactofilin family protein [Orenia marismortui]|uniref:bactofilin family protein n=1 Tax=Orenia marismortui TaxID=46469 RepID=UPI0003696AED|nr:polymer-forming cytoskeletal protein [Orenia marismortui]
MFGRKKKKKSLTKNVGTIISPGTRIEGIVEVAESIRIDGSLEGDLIVKGDVYVGKEGRLKGNIQGDNIMIAGNVEGNIKADGKLEIVETGRLVGDISISNLIIHDGAIFEGNSTSKADIEKKMSDSKKIDFKSKGKSKNKGLKEKNNEEKNS